MNLKRKHSRLTVGKRVTNARKQQKTTCFFFQKSPTFDFRRKKMALKLFESVEKFMMNTFLLKLTQFEQTGSTDKNFISLGNLIFHFHFRTIRDLYYFAVR